MDNATFKVVQHKTWDEAGTAGLIGAVPENEPDSVLHIDGVVGLDFDMVVLLGKPWVKANICAMALTEKLNVVPFGAVVVLGQTAKGNRHSLTNPELRNLTTFLDRAEAISKATGW